MIALFLGGEQPPHSEKEEFSKAPKGGKRASFPAVEKK